MSEYSQSVAMRLRSASEAPSRMLAILECLIGCRLVWLVKVWSESVRGDRMRW